MLHPELFTDKYDSNVMVRPGIDKSSFDVEDTKNLSDKSFDEIERLYLKYDNIFIGQWAQAYLSISYEYHKRLNKQLPDKLASFLENAKIISKQDLIKLISTHIPIKYQEKIFTYLKSDNFFISDSQLNDFISYHAGFKSGMSRAHWAFTQGKLLDRKLISIRLWDKKLKKYTTDIWVFEKDC